MSEVALKKGWTRVAFGDVVKLSGERSSNPEEDGFERFVGLDHMDPGDLRIRRWGDIADGSTFTSVFRPGQVLFGKRRAYQRKVAVADFSGVCSGDIYVLEPKNAHLLPELLPFICQTDGFFEHAVSTSAGSLSPRTNWERLAGYGFALPPLEEQRLLALVLQRAARATETLTRALKVARATRQSLARKLCEADINGPDSILESVVEESRYGPRFSSSLYADDGEIAQLRTTDIDENGNISYKTIPRARLDPEGLKEHMLKDRDLIISRSGTTGMTALFRQQDTPTIPAAFLIRLRTTNEMLPEYLHEFLSSPQGRQMTASLSRGGVQKNINGSQLLAQKVPCPGLARQGQVVSDLLSARNAERAIDNRVCEAKKLQVCLLTQAVRGE